MIWLVVKPSPLWKIWKSIGMMTSPIYGKIKSMFQTTNQMPIVRFITDIFLAVVMLGTPHSGNCSHGDVDVFLGDAETPNLGQTAGTKMISVSGGHSHEFVWKQATPQSSQSTDESFLFISPISDSEWFKINILGIPRVLDSRNLVQTSSQILVQLDQCS